MVSIGDWIASCCVDSLTWLMRRARYGGYESTLSCMYGRGLVIRGRIEITLSVNHVLSPLLIYDHLFSVVGRIYYVSRFTSVTVTFLCMPRARAQAMIPLRSNPEVVRSFSEKLIGIADAVTITKVTTSRVRHWQSFTVHRRGLANQIRAEAAPRLSRALWRIYALVLCNPACIWLSTLAQSPFSRAGQERGQSNVFATYLTCEPTSTAYETLYHRGRRATLSYFLLSGIRSRARRPRGTSPTTAREKSLTGKRVVALKGYFAAFANADLCSASLTILTIPLLRVSTQHQCRSNGRP
jgi:hypothetical protein